MSEQVEEAVRMGLFHEAAEVGEQGLEQLEAGASPSSRLGRVRLRAAIARAHYLGAGLPPAGGEGPELSLESAREEVERATAELRASDPIEPVCTVALLHADILYAIGTPQALRTALELVGGAAEQFLQGGRPLAAHQLMNREAALWLRLGEPQRAQELVQRAQSAFQPGSSPSPETSLEQAATEHLGSRVVLHLGEAGLRDPERLQAALRHAHAAEQIYGELGCERDLARVYETVGRLEIELGHAERAEAALLRAARMQQTHGDALGLARTAAAWSDLAARLQRPSQALDLLVRSVQLNAQVGSPLGLTYNRRALQHLASALGPSAENECRTLERQIDAAVQALAGSEHSAGARPPADAAGSI